MYRNPHSSGLFFSTLTVLSLFVTTLATPARVEKVGPLQNSVASDLLRKSLDPIGYRVTLNDGSILCDVWFRAGVATGAPSGIAGAIYSEIAESTLLGVVFFPKGSKDYRGQAISPGLYTLRYALLPADGNHLGAAPTRDFALLVPVGSERDPDSRPAFDDLLKLSRVASGTNHPAPLNLLPVANAKELPAIDEQGSHIILRVGLKTAAGSELPLALVVKGEADQ